MAQYYVTERISEHISETPQGFLLCRDVPIARTGHQEYLAREIGLDALPANTVVPVNRLDDDVFDPATLASFEGATVTLGHPQGAFVTADNWRNLAVGHLTNVRRGEGDQSHLIMADMLIKDPTTILQVKGGLREVSCGYDCTYVQDEAGEWRQTEIRGNHVAIVPRGRAGAECSIKDSIMSKVIDKVKAIWARATDEAAAAVAAGETEVQAATGVPETPPEPKVVGLTIDADGKATIAADADVSAIVADLAQQLNYLKTARQEADDRIGTLEAAITKLSKEDEPDEGTADAAPDADTIARAEILAPGTAVTADMRAVALRAFAATTDGAKTIHMLTTGKGVTDEAVDSLFIAASELLKATRANALSVTPTQQAADRSQAADALTRINAASAKMHHLF